MDKSYHLASPTAAAAAIQQLLAAPKPWDLPVTTQQLSRHLKTIQHALQQNKDTATDYSLLLPSLQTLFTFGWDADTISRSSEPLPPLLPALSPTKRYLPPAIRRGGLSSAPSSDSEASDAEGGTPGSGIKSSRVRFLALSCLQLLIKLNPKALHPWWPTLLPDMDANLESTAAVLACATPTLAHPLLLDESVRVRHSAAATLSTLLEGPAQRAYLAVAELRMPHGAGQPMRGFVPLSATLGGVVVGTHQALLRALRCEQDPTVLVAVLRVLCTALVGSPYARLPSDLLPSCMVGVGEILHRAQQAQHDLAGAGVSTQTQWSTLLSGSLSCLAAAFGVKPPLPSVAVFLATEGHGHGLSQEILSCAEYSMHSIVQLEAIMALRGLAQQYHQEVLQFWTQFLDLATKSLAAAGSLEMGQNSATPGEKVAQQSVLLVGDYLRKCGDSEEWTQGVESCINFALLHDSPLIRAAGFGAVAGAAADSLAGLNKSTRKALLLAACGAAERDEASPVRAAAAKALASLLAALPLCDEGSSLLKIAPALVKVNQDEVLAVRVQAAAALASAADCLWLARSLESQQGTKLEPEAYRNVLRVLVPSAVRAATDSDKVKPHGVQALGAVLACNIIAGAACQKVEVDALIACLASENAKVQWSACDAAQKVLEAAGETAGLEDLRSGIVDVLNNLATESSNSRTRALAEAVVALSIR